MHNAPYRSALIVEDVKAMRTFLRAMLEEERVRVVEAGSVREARALLRAAAAPHDLVLLDLELPDGNGLDLVGEVSPRSTVIALTADVSRETELLCRNAGCDEVVEKSRELASLRAIVSNKTTRPSPLGLRRRDSDQAYVAFLAEALVDLEEARHRADILAVRRIAHRLRGTAIHFGYPGIGLAAKSVNSALSDGGTARWDAATDSLSARISDALEAHHRNNGTQDKTEISSCEFS